VLCSPSPVISDTRTIKMKAYMSVIVVVVMATACYGGIHGGVSTSVVSPGHSHHHADTHYIKVPVVGHKIVKQPVITYVPKAVPTIHYASKPIHTITSVREEALVVHHSRHPIYTTGPGVSLIGHDFGISGGHGGHAGHGWW
jgi:hypothetical protein